VDHPKTAAQRQLGKMFICRHLETAAQRPSTAIRKNEYVCGYL
jgi:hypothetical protein